MRDAGSPPESISISPNPYVVGTPVRDPSMFFGREAEFDLVRRRFASPSEGGLLVFCGERRSGKTSILFQIVQGRLGPGYLPVLIDMQSMAINSEIEFLTKVSREIQAVVEADGEPVPTPDFGADSNPSAIFLKFVESIIQRRPGKRLILLFDEYELFENKIEAGILKADVLNILANLMEHHSVLLIFTGSEHVEQRRREYWKILGKSSYRHISYLQHADAVSLIEKPVQDKVTYAEGVVEAIYRLSAGHPFYTQAICQSLIDSLNDDHTRVATHEILAKVVQRTVESPFPQMMFLWDALARDEKFVLALLAELQAGDADFVTVEAIGAAIAQGGYGLELTAPHIASACDKLFEKGLLVRGAGPAPGYAFRANVLRHWIRSAHSLWQAMRDEGLEIDSPAGRSPRGAGGRFLAIASGVAVLLIALFVGRSALRRPDGGSSASAVTESGAAALLEILARPAQTMTYENGNVLGVGSFRTRIAAGRSHAITLRAEGYRETTMVVAANPGDSLRREVALAPRTGVVVVKTMPEGAWIYLHGRAYGVSPLRLRLEVPTVQVISAEAPGFMRTDVPVQVRPDTETVISIVLSSRSKDFTVSTDPPGAIVFLDGVQRGASPITLRNVAHGEHDLEARRAGYSTMAFHMRVNDSTGDVHLILTPNPEGK